MYMARRPFSKPIHAKEGHPVPTKGFLQLTPEAAMLPGPSIETRPPPPVPPFLLVQKVQRTLPEVSSQA